MVAAEDKLKEENNGKGVRTRTEGEERSDRQWYR